MVDISSVETVEVPREELPEVFPSLWLPPELYYKQPFFIRLFIPRSYTVVCETGEMSLIDFIVQAIQTKSLRAKCYPTSADIPQSSDVATTGYATQARVDPATLRTPIKSCPKCQTNDIVQVSGTKETMGPYRVGLKGGAPDGSDWPQNVPRDLYVFVFNQCRSYCSSSRLHLRCNLVLGMSVLSEPCFAYSNIFSVLSKIVKKSKKRPPNPSLASAIPPSVQRAIAEQNNMALLRPNARQSFSSPGPQEVYRPPSPKRQAVMYEIKPGQPHPQPIRLIQAQHHPVTDDRTPATDRGRSAPASVPSATPQSVKQDDSLGLLSASSQIPLKTEPFYYQQTLSLKQDSPVMLHGLTPPSLTPPSVKQDMMMFQPPTPSLKQERHFLDASDYLGEGTTPTALGNLGLISPDSLIKPSLNETNEDSSLVSSHPISNSTGPRQIASPSTLSSSSASSSSASSSEPVPSSTITSVSPSPSLATAKSVSTPGTAMSTPKTSSATRQDSVRRHSPTVNDVLKSPPIPHDQLSSTKLLSSVYSYLRKKFP